MTSKAIRVDENLVEQLRKLRISPGTYPTKNYRPSYSATIRKLLYDSQELRKIEQFAMSCNDSTSDVQTFNLANPAVKQKASKKSYKKSSNSIHLFCFDCQIQTPHRVLAKTDADGFGIWKCSQCGTKRNI